MLTRTKLMFLRIIFCSAIIMVFMPETKSEDCQLTRWRPWSQCSHNNPCENQDGTIKKARVVSRQRTMERRPAARSTKSKATMERMMKVKMRRMEDIGKCQQGKCQQNGIWGNQGKLICNENTGMAGNKPCRNINQLAFISSKSLMGTYYNLRDESLTVLSNDVWGWTDPKTKDEWAIVGMVHGTSFVLITDRNNPKVLAFLPARTLDLYGIWRDMKVVRNVVYIVSESADHGLQYFDLLHLRTVESKGVFEILTDNGAMTHFGPAHNIVANEKRKMVIVVGAHEDGNTNFITCEGGLHMIDVSERLNPRFIGCYDGDGYTHDAQCVIYKGKDNNYKGKNVCFCFNEDTLTIVDIEDPRNPVAISVTGYSGAEYTHQGWLTNSHDVLLLDDECDEFEKADERTKTYIWDVTNLSQPRLMNTHISSVTAIDHNQYVKDKCTYQSNYSAGLRVLKINEADYLLNEIAYFDVAPESGIADHSGTWSNYPYFKSGIIPVTNWQTGLYLLELKRKNICKKNSAAGQQPNNQSGFSTRSRGYAYSGNKGPNERKCSSAILTEKKSCVPAGCRKA